MITDVLATLAIVIASVTPSVLIIVASEHERRRSQ